jgi:hypothetical protein
MSPLSRSAQEDSRRNRPVKNVGIRPGAKDQKSEGMNRLGGEKFLICGFTARKKLLLLNPALGSEKVHFTKGEGGHRVATTRGCLLCSNIPLRGR